MRIVAWSVLFSVCFVCVHVGVCVWLNPHCCMICFLFLCSVCVYVGVRLVECALLHGLFFSV